MFVTCRFFLTEYVFAAFSACCAVSDSHYNGRRSIWFSGKEYLGIPQKKKKASVPGPANTETASDRVQQAEDLALKNAAVFLTQEDLFPLLLSPLMSGKLPLTERFLEGFQLLKAAEKDIGHECLARMQALLYVFAGKFLNKDDLQKVKGVISMTILGEMLVKDGLDQGIREGIREGIRQGEEKLGRLIQLLIQNSRSDEIDRAVTDRQYQEELYQEFGL